MKAIKATIPFFYGFGSLHIPASLGQLSSNAIYIVCFLLIGISFIRIAVLQKIHSNAAIYFLILTLGIINSIHYGMRYEIEYGKLFTLAILYAFYLSPLLFISRKDIVNLTLAARYMLLLNVILIISIYLLGYNWQDIVAKYFTLVDTNDPRPRGFFSEVSKYGAYVVWLILLSTFNHPRISWKLVGSYLGLLTILKSKGTLIAALPMILLPRSVFVRTTLGVAFAVLIINILVSSIMTDYQNFLSTSTRVFLFLCSLDILLHSPFGVGFGGFEHAIVSSSLNPPSYALVFRNSEITDTISQGIAVSTKSALMDMVLIFGFPIIVFFVLLIRMAIKNGQIVHFAIIMITLLFTDGYSIFTCIVILVLIQSKPGFAK